MKKFIIALVFGAFFVQAKAQIVLEHTYEPIAQPTLKLVKLSLSGYKYAYYNAGNKQVKIYNLDHTLWKTISLVAPSGAYIAGDIYIAEELFDTDAYVEVAFVVYYGNTSTTIVRSELGSNLISLSGRSNLHIVNTGNNDWKMIVGNAVNGNWEEEVYGLPGTGVPMRIDSETIGVPSEIMLSVFPVPATSALQLNYKVPAQHKNVSCIVVNSLGQEILSQALDTHAETATVDVSNLASGSYIVLLKSQGQILVNSSFVK